MRSPPLKGGEGVSEGARGCVGHLMKSYLKRPLPVRDFRRIHPELPGVVLTGDLLVEQGLASARSGDVETRHAVDRVNGEAEAVGLIANGQFQRRVDVALLLIAAHVYVALDEREGYRLLSGLSLI